MNMKINDFDDLGIDERPARGPRANTVVSSTDLGKLHKLLAKGLPDLVTEAGIFDVERLAKHFGISFQAVYKWFEREQIPAKRVMPVVLLSKNQKNIGAKFKPLVRDDFWEFMSK